MDVPPPKTRFNVMLDALGWKKWVDWPEPIEKLFQSIIAVLVLWFTVTVPGTVLIVAPPATT